MPNYGTAWVDVRGDTGPLAADIAQAVSKGANLLGGAARTVLGDVGRTTAQLSAGFIALGTAGATSLAKIGAQYNTLEQSSLAAFKTLLGTKQAATEMQSDLREFAKSSPFPRQAFIEGSQKMLAFGIEAKKVIPYLDGIQNAVAAAGGSASDLTGIVDVIAKIRSSAAFTLQDLNQLGNRGINAAKLIGSQMNMSETEFRDSIFGAPLRGADAMKALDALIAGMSETYKGAAAGLKDTWVGATDRIKGAWRDLGSGLMDPFISKTGGGSAVESANSIADALRAIEKNILPTLVPLSDLLGQHMTDAATSAAKFVKSVSPTQAAAKLNQIIGVTEKARISLRGLEGVATGVGVAIAGIGARSVLGPLGFLVPAISPITGALSGLVLGSEKGRDALRGLGQQAAGLADGAGRDLLEAFGRLATELEGPIARAITGFGGGLLDAAEGAIPAIVSGLDAIGPPIGRFIDAAAELATKVLPVLGDVLNAGLSAALPVIGAGFELAAAGAEFLAENTWLVVPALTALAAAKVAGVVSGMASAFAGAAEGAKYLAGAVQSIAATQGVSNLTAGMGAAKASAGGLAGTLAAGLNPAVIGVTAAVVAGGAAYIAWKKNNDAVNDAAKELSRTLIEQGGDVLPSLGRAFTANLERNKGADEAWRQTGLSVSSAMQVIESAPGALDKFRAAWNHNEKNMRYLPDRIEDADKAIQPLLRSLYAMYENGSLSADSVKKVVDNLVDVDKGAVLTASNIGLMADRLKAAIGDTKLSSDAQRDLNTALSDSAGIETRRDALARLAAMFPQLAADTGILIDSQGALREKIQAAALSAEDASAVLKSYGGDIKDAGDKSADAGADIELTQENVDGLAKSMDEARQKASELAGKLLELAGGARSAAEAQRNERAAVDDIRSGLADRLKAISDARQAVVDAQSDLEKARAGTDGKVDVSAVETAQRRLADAQEKVTKATAEASRTFDINTEAGRRNWDQMQKVIEAYEATAAALALTDPTGAKSKAKLEELNTVLQQFRAQGVIPTDQALKDLYGTFLLSPEGIDLKVKADVADALQKIGDVSTVLGELPGGDLSGPVIARIQALVDQGAYDQAASLLLGLPGVYDDEEANVVARADQAGLDTTAAKINSVAVDRSLLVRMDLDTVVAERKLREFRKRVAMAWLDFGAGTQVSFGDLLGIKGHRAAGGPVGPGRWLVGERGPEIIDISGAGHVYDAQASRRMLDSKSQSGAEFTQSQIDQLVAAIAARDGISVTVEGSGDGRITGLDIADRLWLRGH